MDTPLFVPSEGQPVAPPGGWTVQSAVPKAIGPGAFKFFDNKSTPAVEVLCISPEGFWVRGVKVEQGPGEAREVYRAFLDFMGMATREPIDPEDTQA